MGCHKRADFHSGGCATGGEHRMRLFRRVLNRGAAQCGPDTEGPKFPTHWSSDGQFVAYTLYLTDRGDYWQCGVPAPKAAIAEMQAKGIEEFRAGIVELAPFLRDRVGELRDWNDLKLLTVRVDRLRQWHRPGLVCIGDAAHAMSPLGGGGINLA